MQVGRIAVICGFALVSLACRKPLEAPEDLDSVAAYLFTEHLAEDPAVMAVGFENLRTWFETDYDPEENRGFELMVPLTEVTVDSLNGSVAWTHADTKDERVALGMGGAAAGTVGVHAIDDYVSALTAIPQDEVFPDTFAEWERTWRLCDGVDFAEHRCDLLEADEYQLSQFGLGFNSEGTAYNQYRWIELDDGTFAMNHRNWQLYPPEVSSNLLAVEDQYYLNSFVTSTDGTEVFRFQATWAVFGDGVPRNTALSLTSSSMFDSSQELEAWLDEQ